MLPHSLSVVVTSFTKGISADITTSSPLLSHRWTLAKLKRKVYNLLCMYHLDFLDHFSVIESQNCNGFPNQSASSLPDPDDPRKLLLQADFKSLGRRRN